MKLGLKDCRIQRGGFRLDASFEISTEGITVVFGPSGAGKSMLLAALAGLSRLDAGRLEFNGRVIEDAASKRRISSHRRGIGLVFQDARLFPHLTVMGNLQYAERRRPAARNAPVVAEIARRLELEGLLRRSVRYLSGGEKSRVALARAIVSAPELLLLDEPFAALDGRRRRDYLALLSSLSRDHALPMMVVTHLVEEAAEIADHVIAIRAGRIVASGSPRDVMQRDEFRALLDPRDVGVRLDSSLVRGGQGGGVWVRADSVLLASERPHGISARNVWEGVVSAVAREPDGAMLVSIITGAGPVLSRITAESCRELQLEEGSRAWAVVKAHAI